MMLPLHMSTRGSVASSLPAAALVAACLTGACNSAPEVLLRPDPGRGRMLGELGPFGVQRVSRSLAPAFALGVETEVSLPFRDLDDVGARPAVVLVQGGFVTVERYQWLATHMASRGFVVLAPHHPLDLAFFAQDNPLNALLGARAASSDPDDDLFERVDKGAGLVTGHSLGGVVAAKAWLKGGPDQLDHLVLLASEPDPADDFDSRTSGRVLSITGSQDAKETPEEAADGAEALPDAQVAIVKGMNHYQWTDDATEGELADDGEPEIEVDAARRLALFLLDALLEDLAGREDYAYEAPSSWPEGLVAQ